MILPAKLPAYSNLNRSTVYQPGEDSFLMMDAIDVCAKDINPTLVVECGVGSGIISSHICARFPKAQIIAVDISPDAVDTAKDTLHRLHGNTRTATIARMDLLSNLRAPGRCDLIVFNPPYVPDECLQGKKNALDLAWNGGIDGVESTHPLVKMIGTLLTPHTGCLLLLLERQNKIQEFIGQYENEFDITEIIHRKVPGEDLYVYRFQRKHK